MVLAELRDVLSRKGRLPATQIEAIKAFLRESPVAPSPAQTLELGWSLPTTNGWWPVPCSFKSTFS